MISWLEKLMATHWVTILQFMRFGIVGTLGFVVDYGFFSLAHDMFGLGHYYSALFSFPFAVSFTWLGNRLFTFGGDHQGSITAQWVRFLTVSAVGFIINRGTFSLLTITVPIVYDYPVIGLLGGAGAGMFFNFFLSRWFVFSNYSPSSIPPLLFRIRRRISSDRQ